MKHRVDGGGGGGVRGGWRRAALGPTKMSNIVSGWTLERVLAGFRRKLTRIFSLPAHSSRRTAAISFHEAATPEAPKRSCSCGGGGGRYYLLPLNAHYEEAIADCIDFFNKSSQSGEARGVK